MSGFYDQFMENQLIHFIVEFHPSSYIMGSKGNTSELR